MKQIDTTCCLISATSTARRISRALFDKRFLGILAAALLTANATPSSALDPTKLKDARDGSNCVTYYIVNGELKCSTEPVQDEASPSDPLKTEKLKLQFDKRTWRPAWANVSTSGSVVEYVLDGEKVGNWSELVTSQTMPGLAKKVNAPQFMEMMLGQLSQQPLKITQTVHQKDPKNTIFEFSVVEPVAQKQTEIQRIFLNGDDIEVVHYAVKGKSLSDADRKAWIANLGAATTK